MDPITSSLIHEAEALPEELDLEPDPIEAELMAATFESVPYDNDGQPIWDEA